MWDVCPICGAVIADSTLHATYHADRADPAPEPPDLED